MFIQYSDVDPDAVIPTLQQYVSEKAAIARTAGLIGVQWPQLTILFCKINEEEATPHSMLRFRHRSTDPVQLLPVEIFPFREHLLFVHYNSNFHELTIYGDTPFLHFQQVREMGFITLADLNLKGACLSYPIDDMEKLYLGHARALQNYFQPLTAIHPNLAFEDLSIELRTEQISKIFTDVVGLAQGRAQDAPMTGESLLKLLISDLVQNEHQDIQYYYGLLLSAMHREFCAEFIRMEKARLGLLVELFFPTELRRASLIRKWFSDVVQLSIPTTARQFYNLPPECQFSATKEDLVDTQVLESMHVEAKRNTPYPGVAFTVPWDLAPFATEFPSLQRGRLILSHYDIGPALENYVERIMLQQVSYLQRQFRLCFAERYWNPINSEMRMLGTDYSDASDNLIRSLTEDTDDEINDGLESLCRLMIMKDPNLILDVALPFLAGLSNLLSVEYYFFVWPPRKGLQAGNREQFYEDNPEIAELHSERVPETREELAVYEYWPPCMREMVERCEGAQHLKYDYRVRMAAQLRKFQYSVEQGTELWTTIFSDTAVYAAHGNQFLTSKQGKIIVEDYARGKIDNIGVGCHAWIAKGFCPLGKSAIVKDIEDIQVRCTDSFNNAHPHNHFPGIVQSPSDYFRMARKTLPRSVPVPLD
jgi:hypothetical protein